MDYYSFSEKKLAFFYRDIILKYELVLCTHQTGYNITRKAFSQYRKSKGIKLIINNGFLTKITEENIIFKTTPFTCFCCNSPKSNQVVSLFAHLRNSFAHGRVERIKIGNTNYLYLTDEYQGACTMEAQIKESLLQEFIIKLLSLTK